MGWVYSGTLVKHAGDGQYRLPYVFAAPPNVTDEVMLEQALWLKENGFRVDVLQASAPSSMTTSGQLSDKDPLPKVTPESVRVYIPRGLRQRQLQKRRRLHKAFLLYHDPKNWPMLRGALRRMGRADLIGSGKHQLVPARQPAGTDITSAVSGKKIRDQAFAKSAI